MSPHSHYNRRFFRVLLGTLTSAAGCVWTGSTAIAETASAPFQAQTIDNRVQIGYGLAIGDVDGDGDNDILLADKKEIVWYDNPSDRSANWPRHVMASNLTARDNVCIAARDLDGDGRVEVAVGGNWNPGETSDRTNSGAVFYLAPPADRTARWQAIQLEPHDPTIHRMHWVLWAGKMKLVVLPLHGIGNRAGHGRPVRLLSYDIPVAAPKRYEFAVLDERMHMTHNFDVVAEGGEAKTESLKIAGREGIEWLGPAKATMLIHSPPSLGAGEVRHIDVVPGSDELVCIEPMHGENVVYYVQQANGKWQRQVLDPSLKQGHALGCADLLGDGRPQVVAGWRNPNGENKVGIKLYRPSPDGRDWTTLLVDDNHMACEDLKIADLDGDGLPEIVAAGRATNNLIVYWNIRSLGLPRERR